jgi:hypothetical protein
MEVTNEEREANRLEEAVKKGAAIFDAMEEHRAEGSARPIVSDIVETFLEKQAKETERADRIIGMLLTHTNEEIIAKFNIQLEGRILNLDETHVALDYLRKKRLELEDVEEL